MGTETGKKVRTMVDSETDEKLMSSICLAEVYSKILRIEGE
jgi:hypothetical protein